MRQRVIRMFISSTFRDMHDEREELIKRIFPQLRKLCEEREVTWGEVDLRWGITQEQAERGEVLPICLAEIERCRPYFLCLLGERYGWVPDDTPKLLVEEYPWLAGYHGKSITELEIIHGVLNHSPEECQAFFYFRNPAYINRVLSHQRDDLTEKNSQAQEKLQALKERIRKGGFPLRENYPDPQTLGQMVLEDVTRVINQEYPLESVPDPLDREAIEHETFAQSRMGVYISRQEYFDLLDTHVNGDTPPLVVTGEVGSGKSALLANWRFKYQESHKDTCLLAHFVDASSEGTHWMSLIRRIIGEFNRQLDLDLETPDQPQALQTAFLNALHAITEQGQVILIIDGLNQLDPEDGGQDLVWLPSAIPNKVRLVVSTVPGKVFAELSARNWTTLHIEPLQPDERKQFINKYLAQYTKSLSPLQVDRIANHDQAANPLYLRALVEELRIYGDYFTLEARIDHYLAASTVEELYERILERYEEDYDRDRPGLVRDSMSLLWTSRHGLQENELLELLGTEEFPLPQAYWSPFYLGAQQFLMSSGGLIRFFHDNFREVVKSRYLPELPQQQATHIRLADYFQSRPLTKRILYELPWQILQSQSWERLYHCLANTTFIEHLWDENSIAARTYWTQVETNSSFRAINAYQSIVQAPEHHKRLVWPISDLLYRLGCLEEAQQLWEFEIQRFRESGDQINAAGALQNCAGVLMTQGRLREAMKMLKEAERIWRSIDFLRGLQGTLNNQAILLKSLGEIDKALALFDEAETICRQLKDKSGIQRILGNRALILRMKGDLEGAMKLHKEAERLGRELSDQEGISDNLANQATILRLQGDFHGALALIEQAVQINRLIGNKESLQAALGNQAIFLINLGELDRAMDLAKEQEKINCQIGFKDGLARSLGNQAQIHLLRSELDTAFELYRQVESIARELGDPLLLQSSLGNQAVILKEQGNLEKAIVLLAEDEKICRQISHQVGLRVCLRNRAFIAETQDDPELALSLYKEEEAICRQLHATLELAQCLALQARLLAVPLARPEKAVAPIKEALELAYELNSDQLIEMIKRVWLRVHAALTMQ